MAAYELQIGFDWCTTRREGGIRVLSWAWIGPQNKICASGEGSPKQAVKFEVDDTVSLKVFDRTGDCEHLMRGYRVVFVPTDEGNEWSPFERPSYGGWSAGKPAEGKAKSPALCGCWPFWTVPEIHLVHTGKYRFMVGLTVSRDGEERIFGLDPEMEVGPDGGPIHGPIGDGEDPQR